MSSRNSKWNDFEHQLWKVLTAHDLDQKDSYLLAVSGGIDSMVLMHAMARVKPQARIRVAHYHHGTSKNSEQTKYRDHVADFVKHKISELNQGRNSGPAIEFIFDRSDRELLSEADMRESRWQFLYKNRLSLDEPILTAHHLDDWFETALLKMLRGTSMEGVAAFQTWNSEIFRPFLNLSKEDLVRYAIQNKIESLDDPSNLNPDYLRNWIREKWLPDLEERQSGSVANMSRSLLGIIEEFQKTSTFEVKFYEGRIEQGIDRSWFLGLSQQEQLKAIALFLKNNQIFEFTRGQLEEIKKRLDKNQKDLTFEIIGRKWVINASQIMLK